MDNFQIKSYVLGPVDTNCYLLYREGKKEGVLVDPADNGEFLIHCCRRLGVEPKAILLTHGHFDHIMAADAVRRAFGCRLYASAQEDGLLKDSDQNLSGSMGTEPISLEADELLRDGSQLSFLGCQWQVISTPGHTAGSVCYYIPSEGVLLSGDTLFCQSLGRTDLPTGSSRAILDSITRRLFLLPDDTVVYPGHGETTTIGYEKRHNPAAVYGNWR